MGWLAWTMAVVTLVSGLVLIGIGTACEHEYSTGCVWYGPLQGNGKGAITINIGRTEQ